MKRATGSKTHQHKGDFQRMVGKLLLAAARTVAELVSRYAALSYR
jgi:hypothetical protein